VCWHWPKTLNAQQVKKTALMIVGVVHTENTNRNSNILLNLVKELDPDIILSETDTLSGYFRNDNSLMPLPKWYKITRTFGIGRKMPPEQEVLYKYKKLNHDVVIYPFDITIKDRPNYVKQEKLFETSFVNELNKASDNKEIPAVFADKHAAYIRYNNYLYEISQKGYIEINQPAVADSIRDMLNHEQRYLPALMDTVKRLQVYKEQYQQRQQYWQLRNETMARHIANIVKNNPGKRILVLTGLLHKHYLIDLLKPEQVKLGFELK
jgi:hypothetical protein